VIDAKEYPDGVRKKIDSLPLSIRQKEIAHLVVCGLSNRKIATKLFISEQTVKDHLYDIYSKLNVHSRGEFTAKALKLPPETS